MVKKWFALLFIILCSTNLILNAQDSLSVTKIEYEYINDSPDNLYKPGQQFIDIAKYGGVTLFYIDSIYRIQYSAGKYEIGDLSAPHRYFISGDIAEEGLSSSQQMPDIYNIYNDDFPKFLWAKDYYIQEDEDWNAEIMEMDCKVVVFYPRIEGAQDIYEVYVTENFPKTYWYPYTFMGQLSSGFLGLFRINEKEKYTEGIEACQIEQIKVSAEFFKIPKGMKIEKMISPPKLNN